MSVITEFLKDKFTTVVKFLFSFSRLLTTKLAFLLAYSPILLAASFLFVVWVILPNFKFDPAFSFQPIKPGSDEIYITLIFIGAFLPLVLNLIFPGMLEHLYSKEKLEGQTMFLQGRLTLAQETYNEKILIAKQENTMLKAQIEFLMSLGGTAAYKHPLPSETEIRIVSAPYEIAEEKKVSANLEQEIKRLESLLNEPDKNYKEIESTCKKLKKNHPDSELPHIILARILMTKKNWDAANKELEDAEKINPENTEIYYHRAVIFRRQDNYPEAKNQIERAMELKDKIPKYFILASYIAWEENDLISAIDNGEKALNLITKTKDSYWYTETLNSLEFYYTLRAAQTGNEDDFNKAGELDRRFDEEDINIDLPFRKPHYVLDTRGTYFLELYKYKKQKGDNLPELKIRAYNFFKEAKEISPKPLDEDIYLRYFETIRLLEEEGLLSLK